MHINYFTIKRQVDNLTPLLQGGFIRRCFSQQKNELLLEIEDSHKETLFLHFSCDAQYPFLLISPAGRHSRNWTELFPELKNLPISQIKIAPGDRVVIMSFRNSANRVYIQLFTAHSNFLLTDSQNSILNSFKKRKLLVGSRFTPPLEQPVISDKMVFELDRSDEQSRLLTVTQFLKAAMPVLTRTAIREIAFRAEIDPAVRVADLSDPHCKKLTRAAEEFVRQCQEAEPMIYWRGKLPLGFSLGPLYHLSEGRPEKFSELNEALRIFCLQSIKFRKINSELRFLEKKIKDRLRYIEKALKNDSARHSPEKDKDYFQKIGQLLLSGNNVEKFSGKTVQLVDYYDPDLKLITVKVDPDKTPKENAEKYFALARKVARRRQERIQRLKTLKEEQQRLRAIEASLNKVESIKELTKIKNQVSGLNLFAAQKAAKEERRPFKSFPFQDYEIWVGRNSRDNDLLTFRWAHKEDLWLHVQGHGGSHVVIHDPQRRNNISPAVLNYAGSLAVTNSSAKHASYVPVIYTKVKYVRKPRKSPPGTVIPSRVKTIYCDPLKR